MPVYMRRYVTRTQIYVDILRCAYPAVCIECFQQAAEAEAEAEKAASEAAEKLKRVEDAKSKKELEEAEAEARKKQKEMKEKKIRANLKVAIKIRKRKVLKRTTDDFKKAKLPDTDGDLPVAERLLKLGDAKDRKSDFCPSSVPPFVV